MPLTNRPEGVRRMIHSMQHCVSDAGSPAYLYARELEIIPTMLDVYSGAASKVLSSESYINCTFPKVRSIRFKFLDPSALEQQAYNAIASPAIESNISAFVQRIKLIAPLAKKITISVSPLNTHEPLFLVQPFSDLVAQLSQLAVDIDYQLSQQPVIFDQWLSGLRNLVYENFDSADGSEKIMQLARRSASTLKSLDIRVAPVFDMTSLIQNDDGSYVQYPCLHTFKLNDQRGSDVTRPPVFPGALPFPSLRHLEIGSLNHFGDDAVFRGNAATL
ncbi:hypothetical protein GGH94_000016 [Coemansia aciculifera]|uniref:Uncharacterized protein n=1 Tax=Coemansia aciculifera TaxID=417176 RepID=A0A9W8M8X3_9FUNG|nr:hypothetical protein GGH94_000016 [Coemansia aciculifera]KAJ2872872.1 hypothetical protein GGH93_003686 [Coemansia aciculifera]